MRVLGDFLKQNLKCDQFLMILCQFETYFIIIVVISDILQTIQKANDTGAWWRAWSSAWACSGTEGRAFWFVN